VAATAVDREASAAKVAAQVAAVASAQSIVGTVSGAAGMSNGSSANSTLAVETPQATHQAIAPTSAAYTSSAPAEVTGLSYTAPVDCGSSLCQLPLDIYVPTGPGPYPTVVLLRGGPGGIGGRSYLASFAESLAASGLLVYSIDVRDLSYEGGGYPEAMQDTACAIRYARGTSASYGGDADLVTLVGHSFGAYIGSIVAVNSVQYQGGCLYDGSGRPDAFVGIAGCYDVADGGNADDFANFFGGSAAETADERYLATPYIYASGPSIPVRLVAGTADGTVDPIASQDLDTFLAQRSWNVEFDFVSGGSHMSVLTSDGQQTVLSAIVTADTYSDAVDQVSGKSGS
jgi:acetyl esterase/lipase